jgi:hypothetical protein
MNNLRKKDLFWLTDSEVLVKDKLDPLPWAQGEKEHHDSESMWIRRLFISWQPGSTEKETGRDHA